MDRTEMIERLEEIAKHAVHTLGEEPFFMSLDDGIAVKEAIEIISAQPERTKGKWIHDGYDFPQGNDWIHCSICGKKGINVPADLTNFCPNCGADMREKGENATD